MDTRFIQTLLSVVDAGSFAGAARTGNMTPAAVSQRIRSLEAELGMTLIVRAGQQVAPTHECLSILARMRHIVSEVRQIAMDLDTTGLCGPIRLGAISTALSDRVSNVLAQFGQQAPQANLNIVPGTSIDLYSKLLNEEIDAAYLIRPPFKVPKTMVIAPIEIQPFVLIVQVGDKRSVEKIISTEKALIYDLKSWGGRLVLPWIKKRILPEQILCELDALEAIAAAVGQGIGFGIVPDWHGLAKLKSVKRIPLPEIEERRELILLHRRLNPASLKLLQS
jgi:DNA-binding transcriptional LysR family regulator